jgi:hypothetical protein
MKTIKFKISEEAQSNFIVLLGNGHRFTVKSKREYNRILAAMNRKCTGWMIESNEIFIDLLINYRRAWLLMRNNKSGYNYKAETICNTHLEAIDNRLNHLANRSGSDLYMYFIDMKKILLFGRVICTELIGFYEQKNNAVMVYGIKSIEKRIMIIQNEILNYKPV